MAALRRFVHAVGERITGKHRADERDQGVNRVMNDVEIMKREMDIYRRYGRREEA